MAFKVAKETLKNESIGLSKSIKSASSPPLEFPAVSLFFPQFPGKSHKNHIKNDNFSEFSAEVEYRKNKGPFFENDKVSNRCLQSKMN